MNNFIYDVPVKVYFGEGMLNHLGDELIAFGKKVLMVYGGGSIKKIGLYDEIISVLKNSGITVFELGGIEPNPKITSVRDGVEICKQNSIDVVLAVGGGSTIDAAKGIAAGAKVSFDPWRFYIGEEKINDALPIVAVLTNAATGSDMNVNSVVSKMDSNDKYGTKGRAVLPRVTFLNPKTTFSVSAFQTACGAADIISHIFECYFNQNPDLFMLDCVMEGLIKTVVKYAPIAMREPNNYEARANLMWASSWALNGFIRGGKQLAWSCHPIEHELSAYYDITHGLGLAILTPRWLKFCLSEKTAWRYAQLGKNVFAIDKNGDVMAEAKECINKFEEFFFNTLNLSSTLTQIGIDDKYFDIMANKVCKGDCVDGFIKLYHDDIVKILHDSL